MLIGPGLSELRPSLSSRRWPTTGRCRGQDTEEARCTVTSTPAEGARFTALGDVPSMAPRFLVGEILRCWLKQLVVAKGSTER